MTTPKKETTIADLFALVQAIPVYCAGKIINLSGVEYTAAEAAAIPQTLLEAEATLAAARAAHQAAILARDQAVRDYTDRLRMLRQTLNLMFNGVPTALAALHLKGRPPRAKLTIEQILTKVAKAKATRLARGTKSKKQRSRIFGDVTGVEITPIVTPEE